MPGTPVMSVTSFSLREQFGPIRFTFRDPSGADQTFTLDAPKLFSISEFPQRAADVFGVEVIETGGFHFDGLEDPEVDRFETALRQTGVGLLNVALDLGDLADADAARRTADVAEHKRWIERFAAMGSQFVRVNTGSPFSTADGPTPPAQIVETLVELGEFATKHGTRLLVENHIGPSSNADWMSALLHQVGRDACGLLLDLGNFEALLTPLRALRREGGMPTEDDVVALADTLDLTGLYEGIEKLAPRAELVSVKEHIVLDDGTIGFVDLDSALGILVESGFDGAYSVEYEGIGGDPWKKTLRVLEATRDVVTSLSGR